MILSASRRTDIPCYYSEWLLNRLKEGFVLTRNPFNHAQLSRIQLSPDVVDCIVFWTKDPQNMLSKLEIISELGYKYYFQFTLTPYDSSIEQNLRAKSEIEETFIRLSNLIGKKRVVWRYDPIVINDVLTLEWHKLQFERMCEKLSPYTDCVTISFVDTYAKVRSSLIREITSSEINELAGYIGETAKVYGLSPKACCELTDLVQYNIEKSSCINRSTIEEICGISLQITSDKNQRKGCGCVESIDIGAYNTCINGCIYCYANNSSALTKRRYESHHAGSELLIGEIKEGEEMYERKVKSNKRTGVY